MTEHTCKHEGELGEMLGLTKRLISQVYGNGQKGLAQTVPELSIKIDNLSETIVLLTQNVSALMKSEATIIGVEKYKEREGLSSMQRAGLYISAIIGVCTIITAVILKLL